MPNDDSAPKQLKWTDPENLFITANRLKREGYSVTAIAEAMEISVDAVDRLLSGTTTRTLRLRR
jgi:plasmid maintenance system antidote protein VapI